MRHTMRTLGTILVTVAVLALAGCGDSSLFDSQSDSSGREAELEAGVVALDAGDWQTARTIFAAMDQSDPEVAKYHASTYLAEAGFNAIELLRELSKASDDADGGQVMYESLTRMFDTNADGILTAVDAAGKLDAIRGAMTVLGVSLNGAGRAAAAPPSSDELTFQAGLYAAVYAVVSVIEQLEDPSQPGNLLLSLDSLRASVDANAGRPIGAADGSGPGVAVPANFDMALGLVYDAVMVINVPVFDGSNEADGSEVRDALEEFLTDLGYLPDLAVSVAELRTYLYGLLPAN